MRFGVLGPLAVWTDDGVAVAVPGLKVRALLADLLVGNGRPVSADRLIDDLWGESAPGNAASSLQVRVSQLRRVLENAEPGARALVESHPAGYLLDVQKVQVDALRFVALAGEARQASPAERVRLLTEALCLWRGPVLADFADEEFVRPVAARLEEQRLVVLEEYAEARLELGEHVDLAGELTTALDSHPMRERLVAAHMRALYRSGRQAEALDSYARHRTLLADELGLDPTPELAALHQAILTQEEPAGQAKHQRARTNLPAPATELVGRDTEVTELRDALADDRLVTLTGSGGVGKTRLSIEVAAGLADRFPDGVWQVDLTAFERTAGPELVDGIMAVLDIHEAAEPGDALDHLAGALAARRLLLLLDNCEHVVDAIAGIAERLLHAAPGLTVLATSREPLNLPGETVWNVPPLPVPARDTEPERLDEFAAVRLFTARARAAARNFRLDEGTAPDVATLCRRLDGIPLALELAATRVRALGVRGLVERLDDRFRLLATGHRGAPPRQQTLMAMIDWSWELLDSGERAVLRRLSVHADGCAPEAAEAVCADLDADVLDVLIRLVDRSLVVMTERPGDAPRYRLLESVAAYCADRLQEAGERADVRARHRAHFLDLAERAEARLRGPDQARWLERLDTESANLRAALDSAVADRDPERALRLVNALTWYWFLRGRWNEARRSLTAVLDLTEEGTSQRARALVHRTALAVLQGDDADWPAARARAVAALDDIDDAVTRARTRWFLLFAGSEYDDVDDGVTDLAPALEELEALGDDWGTAAALALRAKHGHARGNPEALERDADRSLRLFTRLGDRWGRLQASEWLAGHAELIGDYDRAEHLGREGMRLAEELRLWPHAAIRMGWLGWVALLRADYDRARDLFERTQRTGVEQGNQGAVMFGEVGLGMVDRRQGELDRAEDRLGTILKLLPPLEEDIPPPLFLPLILVALGYAAELRDDARAALIHQRDALRAAVLLAAPRDEAFALEGLAGAVGLGGDHAHAARLLGAAARVRADAGIPPGPAEREDLERVKARTLAGLDEATFTAESERGAALSAREHLALLRPL